MGTAALEDPGLVATISERQPVALGLDVRGREVAVRGWAEGSGVDWSEALRRLADAGAEAVVVTQIDVEGLMGGADAGGLAEVLARSEEHTSELQSLMRKSYAVLCLKTKQQLQYCRSIHTSLL